MAGELPPKQPTGLFYVRILSLTLGPDQNGILVTRLTHSSGEEADQIRKTAGMTCEMAASRGTTTKTPGLLML